MDGFDTGNPETIGFRKTGCIGGTTDFGILDCPGSMTLG
jgi:hypothetical protein